MKIRHFFQLFIAILSIFCLQSVIRKGTDGFALNKIHSNLAYHPDWEVPPLSAEEQQNLKTILDQPYFYLTRGAQSYVFLSEDKNYVIKFFRLHRLLPPAWVTDIHWPFRLQPYRLKKIINSNQSVYKDFVSYTIAFNKMREETGLIFLHLNKTSNLKQKMTLHSPIHIAHEIDLDQMEFIVQKRADLIYPSLQKMMDSQEIEKAKEHLTSLIELLVLRCQKGILDKDPKLSTNFGFIDNKARQIDIGRFTLDPLRTDVNKIEIIHITDNLNQWLKQDYPVLSYHLEKLIADL